MKTEEGLIEKLRGIFVSLERYELEVPQLKQILYGAIGMIVVGVFTYWISLAVKK